MLHRTFRVPKTVCTFARTYTTSWQNKRIFECLNTYDDFLQQNYETQEAKENLLARFSGITSKDFQNKFKKKDRNNSKAVYRNLQVFDALASLENKSKLAERALIYRHQPDFEHILTDTTVNICREAAIKATTIDEFTRVAHQLLDYFATLDQSHQFYFPKTLHHRSQYERGDYSIDIAISLLYMQSRHKKNYIGGNHLVIGEKGIGKSELLRKQCVLGILLTNCTMLYVDARELWVTKKFQLNLGQLFKYALAPSSRPAASTVANDPNHPIILLDEMDAAYNSYNWHCLDVLGNSKATLTLISGSSSMLHTMAFGSKSELADVGLDHYVNLNCTKFVPGHVTFNQTDAFDDVLKTLLPSLYANLSQEQKNKLYSVTGINPRNICTIARGLMLCNDSQSDAELKRKFNEVISNALVKIKDGMVDLFNADSPEKYVLDALCSAFSAGNLNVFEDISNVAHRLEAHRVVFETLCKTLREKGTEHPGRTILDMVDKGTLSEYLTVGCSLSFATIAQYQAIQSIRSSVSYLHT